MNPVQILQQKLKLTPDGVIGPKTFAALRLHWNLTGIQLAHFLGQCEHETGGFTLFTENLNYSSQALRTVFARHYPEPLLATQHHRKPQLIANHVYGGRMGNHEPDHGFLYRGRGAVQLTGFNNYRAFSEWKKDPSILLIPDQVATVYAFDSAIWFFETNRVWRHTVDLSDRSILAVSRAINLGNALSTATPNGLQDRINKTRKYQAFI